MLALELLEGGSSGHSGFLDSSKQTIKRMKGYRPHEYNIKNKKCKRDVKVVFNTLNDPSERRDVSEALWLTLRERAPLKPDLWDPIGTAYGVFNRVSMLPPTADLTYIMELGDFVLSELKRRKVRKLDPSFDLSQDWWLSETKYPDWRKDELREAWERCDGKPTDRDWRLKCFVKDEFYMEPKSFRNIFPRGDAAKAYEGPPIKICEIISKDYFPEMIKPIPVVDRPGYIMEKLYIPGAKYAATDYTSFESHFVKLLMLHVEFVLYEWILSDHPEGRKRILEIKRRMTGTNYCMFKHFNVTLEATRMSGEMCTSLGNGFSNLMFFLFACSKEKITCTGVVEGDDGLFVCSPKVPEQKTFEKMGLTIKLEEHHQLETASFCGIVFDKTDLINVTDPLEVCLTFGWSKSYNVGMNRIRKLELFRAKALSFAYQYKGCPIVQSLAHCALRLSKHIDLRRYLLKDRSINMWEREQLLEALEYCKTNKMEDLKIEIPQNTRLLVQSKFGISIDDQILIEKFYDSINTLEEEIYCPDLDKYCADVWGHFDAFYVHKGMDNYTPLNVPKYEGQLWKDFGSKIVFTKRAENGGVDKYVKGI